MAGLFAAVKRGKCKLFNVNIIKDTGCILSSLR